MPEVSVEVAGRNYRLGCGEGEEVHLVRLAEIVDQEASRLQRKLGQLSEGRLMLMAALMLADKLTDAGQGAEASAKVQTERDQLRAETRALTEKLAKVEASEQEAESRAEAAEELAIKTAEALTAFKEEQATSYGPEREEKIAEALDGLASRIEALTDRIETPA